MPAYVSPSAAAPIELNPLLAANNICAEQFLEEPNYGIWKRGSDYMCGVGDSPDVDGDGEPETDWQYFYDCAKHRLPGNTMCTVDVDDNDPSKGTIDVPCSCPEHGDGAQVTKAGFLTDMFDIMLVQMDEFLSWATVLLDKYDNDPDFLDKYFDLWYPEAAPWIEFLSQGGTPDTGCYKCDGEGALSYWYRQMGEVIERIDRWIYGVKDIVSGDDAISYIGGSCSGADAVWCVPPESCSAVEVYGGPHYDPNAPIPNTSGEDYTFDSNGKGVRGDMEDVVACLDWNANHHGSSDAAYEAYMTSIMGQPYVDPGARGNAEKFERCLNYCRSSVDSPGTNQDCIDLPRSIIPGADVILRNYVNNQSTPHEYVDAFINCRNPPQGLGHIDGVDFVDQGVVGCSRACNPEEMGFLDALGNLKPEWNGYFNGLSWDSAKPDITVNEVRPDNSCEHLDPAEVFFTGAGCVGSTSDFCQKLEIDYQYADNKVNVDGDLNFQSRLDELIECRNATNPSDETGVTGCKEQCNTQELTGVYNNLEDGFILTSSLNPSFSDWVWPTEDITINSVNLACSGWPNAKNHPGWKSAIDGDPSSGVNTEFRDAMGISMSNSLGYCGEDSDLGWQPPAGSTGVNQMGFVQLLEASKTEAENQVDKFRHRLTFLNARLEELINTVTILTNARTAFEDFFLGAADLIRKRHEADTAAKASSSSLPDMIIYAWESEKDEGEERGLWHIVKVEGKMPKRCNSSCGPSQAAGSGDPWPQIKSEKSGFLKMKKCYMIDQGKSHGVVKFRTIRFDENKKRSRLFFPNGVPIWEAAFGHPAAGESDIDRMISVCSDHMIQNPKRSEYVELPASVGNIYEGAFMLNSLKEFDPDFPDNEVNKLCWEEAHKVLSNGIMSETCAEFYYVGGGFTFRYRPCVTNAGDPSF